jgi:hypothetical protein
MRRKGINSLRSSVNICTEPEFVNLALESIPWNRFLGIDSLESIPGILKRLQIRALDE